jgi:phage baseplate assembly protein W
MSNLNFSDFYIRYKGHPRFTSPKFIEDETVSVIVQKYEMILFTNKGELLGDPNFGCDLTALLFETYLSSSSIEAEIRAQISDYIPELDSVDYQLTVEINEDPENFQEYMYVFFTISEYEVSVRVK